MMKEFDARRLDVKALARAGATLSAQDALQDYPRLAEEAQGEAQALTVSWSARGEMRIQPGGAEQVWLHLQAQASLPMTCQRCLGPVAEPAAVDRWFRFEADEETAAALDDDSEEDVLAISREFDLIGLVEDELLMALPLVPRHEVCPTEVKMQAKDVAFDAESAARANPFAALAGLRIGKPK